MATTISSNYLNRYERLNAQLRYNEAFSQEAWDNAADTDNLAAYAQAVSETTDEQFEQILKDYQLNYASDTIKSYALLNEKYGDKTNSVKRTRVTGYVNGVAQTEDYYASDYDYTKEMIMSQGEAAKTEYLAQVAEEQKESLNGWAKAGATIAATAGEVGVGLVSALDSLITFFGGIGNGISTAMSGGSFSEGYVSYTSDDSNYILGSKDLQEALDDYESSFTVYKNTDGTDTGSFSTFVQSIMYSAGQMLPSVAIGWLVGGPVGAIANGIGTATKVGKALLTTAKVARTVAATTSFYASMAADNTYDTVQYLESQGYTYSTAAVMGEAMTKAVAQAAEELLLDKFVGGSVLDNMVLGTSLTKSASKTLTKSGLKRMLKDAVKEGVEEVIQDTSDAMIDNFYGLFCEGFGEITSVDFSSLTMSFLAGSVMSLGGHAFKLATTKKIKTGVKDVKVKTKKNGETKTTYKYNKLNKIASLEYGITMQSLAENANKVLDIAKKAGKTRIGDTNNFMGNQVEGKKNIDALDVAISEIYLAYKMIATIYNTDPDAFNKANDLLTKLQHYSESKNYLSTNLEDTMNSFLKAVENGIGAQFTASHTEVIKKKLEEAGMSEMAAMINKDGTIVSGELDAESDAKLKKMINDAGEDIERVVVTRDGKRLVLDGRILFVPLKQLQNTGDTIYESIAEETLVNALVEGDFKGFTIKDVTDIYREVSGNTKATEYEAALNLFFNPSFFRIVLSSANKDCYKLLTSLVEIEKVVVPNNQRNEAYKKKLNQVIKDMHAQVYDYLCYQTNAPIEDVSSTLLSAAEKRTIRAKRWCQDLANRVINDPGKLSAADKRVLDNRINAMTASNEEKQNIRQLIESNDKNARKSGMNAINKHYADVFTNWYDGRTYLRDTCLGNRLFNVFLQDRGLTIGNMFDLNILSDEAKQYLKQKYKVDEITVDTLKQYYRDTFATQTNGFYEVEFDSLSDGTNVILLHTTTEDMELVGYDHVGVDLDTENVQDRTSTTRANSHNAKLFNKILSDKISPALKAYLTIDDVINRPWLLSDKIKAEINDEYGELTSANAYSYLQGYIVGELENTTLLVASDGSFVLGNFTYSENLLVEKSFQKAGTKILHAILNDEAIELKDIIDEKYLIGSLKNTKIKFIDDPTDRSRATANKEHNTIVINKAKFSMTDMLNTNRQILTADLVLHEFQHMLQSEMGLAIGFSANLLDRFSPDTQWEIICDLINHMEAVRDLAQPILDELHITDYKRLIVNKKAKETFLADKNFKNRTNYMIYSSVAGEIDARGFTQQYTFVPFRVAYGQENKLYTPWGTSYRLTDGDISSALVYRNSLVDLSLMSPKNYVDYSKRLIDKKLTKETVATIDQNAIKILSKELDSKYNLVYDAKDCFDQIQRGNYKNANNIMSSLGNSLQVGNAVDKMYQLQFFRMHNLLSNNQDSIQTQYDQFLRTDMPVITILPKDVMFQKRLDYNYFKLARHDNVASTVQDLVNTYKKNWPELKLTDAKIVVGAVLPQQMYLWLGNNILLDYNLTNMLQDFDITQCDSTDADITELKKLYSSIPYIQHIHGMTTFGIKGQNGDFKNNIALRAINDTEFDAAYATKFGTYYGNGLDQDGSIAIRMRTKLKSLNVKQVEHTRESKTGHLIVEQSDIKDARFWDMYDTLVDKIGITEANKFVASLFPNLSINYTTAATSVKATTSNGYTFDADNITIIDTTKKPLYEYQFKSDQEKIDFYRAYILQKWGLDAYNNEDDLCEGVDTRLDILNAITPEMQDFFRHYLYYFYDFNNEMSYDEFLKNAKIPIGRGQSGINVVERDSSGKKIRKKDRWKMKDPVVTKNGISSPRLAIIDNNSYVSAAILMKQDHALQFIASSLNVTSIDKKGTAFLGWFSPMDIFATYSVTEPEVLIKTSALIKNGVQVITTENQRGNIVFDIVRTPYTLNDADDFDPTELYGLSGSPTAFIVPFEHYDYLSNKVYRQEDGSPTTRGMYEKYNGVTSTEYKAKNHIDTSSHSDERPDGLEKKITDNQQHNKKHTGAKKKEVTKRGYVSKERAKGTNLEKYNYTGKQVSEGIITFVKDFDESYLSDTDADTTLLRKLKKGEATARDVDDYLRDVGEDMSEQMFHLINKSFYHNKYIKSTKDLKYFVENTGKYYAARMLLRLLGKEDILLDATTDNIIDVVSNTLVQIANNENSYITIGSKKYKVKDLMDKFEEASEQYEQVDTSKKMLRRLWMLYYDGKPSTAGGIGGIASWVKIANRNVTGETSTTSMDTQITLKGKNITATTDETINGLDSLIADTSKDVAQELVDNLPETKLISQIIRMSLLTEYGLDIEDKTAIEKYSKQDVTKLAQNMYNKRMELEDLSQGELRKQLKSIYNKMSDEQKMQLLLMDAAAESKNMSAEQAQKLNELQDISNKSLAASNDGGKLVKRAKSLLNTIRDNVPKKMWKYVYEGNEDIISKDLKLITDDLKKPKTEGSKQLVYKTADEVQPVLDRVRAVAELAKQGEFDTVSEAHVKQKLKKVTEQLEQAKKQKEKYKEKAKQQKTQTIHFEVSDETIEIDANRPLPAKLTKILDNSFTQSDVTKVKFLTNEEAENKSEEEKQRHVRMNWKEFLEQNADILAELTDADAREIIDFYHNTAMIVSTNKQRQYAATRIYLLTYILQKARMGDYVLSEEMFNQLETDLTNNISIPAAMLAAWRTAKEALNPAKVILGALARREDIEIAEEDLNKIYGAMATGDYNKARKYKKEAFNNAKKKWLEKQGKTKSNFDIFLKKLSNFERMCMLSSPGTWARNFVSNVTVKVTDNIAAKIGNAITKLFPNKFKAKQGRTGYTGQYKIVGTKVTAEAQAFVNSVKENKVWDLFETALTKYDNRKSKSLNITGKDALTQLVQETIAIELMNENSYNNRFLDWCNKGLSKVLNDNAFIRSRAEYYLGRLVVEDNLTVKQLQLNNVQAIQHVVTAWRMAAQDYMHKTNIFNSIEKTVQDKLGTKGWFVYKQFFPFVSTAWSWFNAGLDYSPVGLVKGIINYARAEQHIAKYEANESKGDFSGTPSEMVVYKAIRQLGKGAIGTIGTIIGCILAGMGIVGLDEEDDKYKLRFGSTYVDISSLFGSQGILMGMAITQKIRDGFDEDDNIGDQIWDVFKLAMDVTLTDSIVDDLVDTFRYTDSVGDYIAGVPNTIFSMFVPNFLKTLMSFAPTKSVQYDDGILGNLEKFAVKNIPLIAYAMPKQVDPYTGEVQYPYHWDGFFRILNKLLPIDIAPYNMSDTELIAATLDVSIGQLSCNYTVNDEKVKLNSTNVTLANQFYGQLNKSDYESFINNKTKYKVQLDDGSYKELTYKQMTDKQKKTVLKRIASQNSTYAKIYILTQNGYKYYASDSEYKTLKKLGISNVYKETKKLSGFVKS